MLWIICIIRLIPTLIISNSQQIFLLEWLIFHISSTPIILTLIIDPIGMSFSSVVLFISANVIRFSTIYMSHEKYKIRFTVLVLLFILSINLLIFLPHFIILLIGWDGLGITSFILVIYYQNPKSLAAGIITALTNRIGDVILLLSIAWTLNQGHWLILNMWDSRFSFMQVFCIIVAAITKSAQIPFSRWLPAAIAAPTPVSALVHSSTLVTAGVFLLIRFYPFLHSLWFFNTTLLLIAVTTILMAGLRATTECDMKKIIALSTLSQLGIMITRLGLNLPHLAYFHILTHALFKALLFVCAGSFIHTHHHTQDLRWFGNLSHNMPVARSCVSLANLALCGFPFIAGFYSKDIIIEASVRIPNRFPIVLLAILSLGLTSFYSIRFSLVTLWAPSSRPALTNISEDMPIIKPILALSLTSISVGAILAWLPPIRNFVYPIPNIVKFMPLEIVIVGIFIGWMVSTQSSSSKSMLIKSPFNHYASCLIWFLVPLSSQFTIKLPFKAAHYSLKHIDQGWLEVISGINLNKIIIKINNNLSSISPKSPISYLVVIVTSSITALSIYLIRC